MFHELSTRTFPALLPAGCPQHSLGLLLPRGRALHFLLNPQEVPLIHLSACPGLSGWQHSPLVNQPLSQHCIAGDGRAKGRIWQMAQSLLPSGFKLKKPSDFVDFISPHITSTQLHSQVTWTFWDDSLRSSACCSVHPWLYLERNTLILWHLM